MRENKVRYELNRLFFADYTVLMAYSEENLQMFVCMFSLVYKKRKMKVNTKKCKFMSCN